MRILHQALYALQKLYWQLFRPTILGCRALIIENDQVLLVHQTYLKGWCLPGGGVDRGESYHDATRREVREECGLEIEEMKLFGLYINRRQGKVDHIAVFDVNRYRKIEGAQLCSEIAESRFFPLNDLPSTLWPGHRRRIEERLGQRSLEERWS